MLSFPQRNQLISIVLLKCRAGSALLLLPLLILFAIAILFPLPPFGELWHFYINCFVVVFIEIFEVTFAIVAFGQLPERMRERERGRS